jgi:hypothetical protein
MAGRLVRIDPMHDMVALMRWPKAKGIGIVAM